MGTEYRSPHEGRDQETICLKPDFVPRVIACDRQRLVEYSKGRSIVRKGQKREGVVMRNVPRNISFKVINPDFLLAEKD